MCLSKYAWALPPKTKSGAEVTKAFAKIFKDRYPKNLQTDQGKEFYNADVQKLLTKHDIKSLYDVFGDEGLRRGTFQSKL